MRRVPVWAWIVLFIGLLAAGGAVASLVPTNTLAIAPHKPVDLRGRLRIGGEVPEPPHGHIFLVGVTEARVTLLQRWLLSFDRKVTLEEHYSQSNEALAKARDRAAIKQSKNVAAAAAFTLLGRPVEVGGGGANVSYVDRTGPSEGLIKVGDRIVRVDGRDVHSSLDVTGVVGSAEPGSTIVLGVRRDNHPIIVRLRTAKPLEGDDLHRSRIGLGLTTPRLDITLPEEVALKTDDVVGPSAGLAFALAIFDAESPVDLLRGRYVVATGALSLEGEVLEVGGVRQKAIATQLANHDILVVPKANVPDAVAAVREFCKAGDKCVDVLGVGSVAQAVEFLELDSRELEAKFAK